MWCLDNNEVDACSGISVVPVLPSAFNGTEPSGHTQGSMTAE